MFFGDVMFSIALIFIGIIFIIVFGVIIFGIFSSIKQGIKNNNSPLLTVPAKVVSKRMSCSRRAFSHYILCNL